MQSVNDVFIQTLKKILEEGKDVTCRGFKTKEILGHQTIIDMSKPLLTVEKRNLGFKFLAAEASWIMSGDNKVSTIQNYSKIISNFSDNGDRFFGSYGPKIIDQITYIVETFNKDLHSRQAYINIWREQPRNTKDVPCTLGLQFLIRDGKLHCFDTMRSSDIWLGWPYDIFNMSMISLGICLMLRDIYGYNIELGNLTLTAASQHLYEDKFIKAEQVVKDYFERELDLIPNENLPFETINFTSYQDIIDKLNNTKNHDCAYAKLHRGLF